MTIYSRDRLQSVTLDIQPSERYSKYYSIPFTTMDNILSIYNYTIKYRKTSEHVNSDGLSKLSLSITGKSFEKVCDVGYVKFFGYFPVTFKQIAKETVKDTVLGKVIKFTKDGWPLEVEQRLSNYFSRHNEISVVQNCLIWNNRVIIPECFQETFFCKQPPKTTVHAWEWPSQPYKRIHVDFAGPFMGRFVLVMVDANSRWPEIQIIENITTDVTMGALTKLFSRYGIYDTLVRDNGATFVSEKIQKFFKINGIVHKTTSVYKPSTNGLVERMVQLFVIHKSQHQD